MFVVHATGSNKLLVFDAKLENTLVVQNVNIGANKETQTVDGSGYMLNGSIYCV